MTLIVRQPCKDCDRLVVVDVFSTRRPICDACMEKVR